MTTPHDPYDLDGLRPRIADWYAKHLRAERASPLPGRGRHSADEEASAILAVLAERLGITRPAPATSGPPIGPPARMRLAATRLRCTHTFATPATSGPPAPDQAGDTCRRCGITYAAAHLTSAPLGKILAELLERDAADYADCVHVLGPAPCSTHCPPGCMQHPVETLCERCHTLSDTADAVPCPCWDAAVELADTTAGCGHAQIGQAEPGMLQVSIDGHPAETVFVTRKAAGWAMAVHDTTGHQIAAACGAGGDSPIETIRDRLRHIFRIHPSRIRHQPSTQAPTW